MTRAGPLTILLAMLSPSAADELVLKDGRTIPWRAIRDAGDTYEVETQAGDKLTLKKSDVESFRQGPKVELLTGATFTFDKKKRLDTLDYLRRIDVKRDGVTGSWALRSGGLVGSADGIKHSRLELGEPPTDEYDLVVVAERKEGDDEFFIGLVGGGRQFVARFDWARGTSSGLASPGADPASVTVPGKSFENRKPRTILCMVRKEGVAVRLDGKDFAVCKTNWSGTSLEAMYAVRSSKTLFVGCGGAGCVWNVTQITLSSPKN